MIVESFAALQLSIRKIGRSFRNGTADQWSELWTPAMRIAPWAVMMRLWLRNIWTRSAITTEGGPVVSMTSHGNRLKRVFLAIESIGAGQVRPGRLILWIDNDNSSAQLNPALRRLVKRGLEVRRAPNYGPHTKYYPCCVSEISKLDYLVTADDDILYAKWWLRQLIDSFRRFDSQIAVGYRVRKLAHSNGRIFPYNSWRFEASSMPNMLGVITGVSGAVYPRALLDEIVRRGTEFEHASFSADDLWLTRLALDINLPRAQVLERSVHFWNIPGTQSTALMKVNVDQSRNDIIAGALFPPEIIEKAELY